MSQCEGYVSQSYLYRMASIFYKLEIFDISDGVFKQGKINVLPLTLLY